MSPAMLCGNSYSGFALIPDHIRVHAVVAPAVPEHICIFSEVEVIHGNIYFSLNIGHQGLRAHKTLCVSSSFPWPAL